jgi:hypothetical protein
MKELAAHRELAEDEAFHENIQFNGFLIAMLAPNRTRIF